MVKAGSTVSTVGVYITHNSIFSSLVSVIPITHWYCPVRIIIFIWFDKTNYGAFFGIVSLPTKLFYQLVNAIITKIHTFFNHNLPLQMQKPLAGFLVITMFTAHTVKRDCNCNVNAVHCETYLYHYDVWRTSWSVQKNCAFLSRLYCKQSFLSI